MGLFIFIIKNVIYIFFNHNISILLPDEFPNDIGPQGLKRNIK